MIVQIFEVNNLIEARTLAELGVDHIGVLVGKGEYPRELNYKQAKEIFKSLPKGRKGVALSLSPNLEEILELVKKTGPDILLLGTLLKYISPADVSKIKQDFPSLKIMRSIPVVDEETIETAKNYEEVADYLLLDTYKEKDTQIGATGRTHNWEISRRIVENVKIPVILAGGLGPDNVAEAIKRVRPAGVDSKTKTDRADGQGKDMDKVREFVKMAKA